MIEYLKRTNPWFWAGVAAALFALSLPSLFAYSNGAYFYALVIWPISVVVGAAALILTAPGVAVAIFVWKAKRLDKVQSIKLSARNRAELWIAAAGFAGLAAWEVARAFLEGDRLPVVTVTIGLVVDAVMVYLVGRWRWRRHYLSTTATLVRPR
jgi:hypothetical protein